MVGTGQTDITLTYKSPSSAVVKKKKEILISENLHPRTQKLQLINEIDNTI